jgi:acetolactate synthase-1/2/3 large subunit
MIRWKQAVAGMADWGLQFGNPDFVAYAKSYGAEGHRVEAADDFVSLLERCFDAGGVHLIDTPIDYSENVRVLIEELGQKVCLI